MRLKSVLAPCLTATLGMAVVVGLTVASAHGNAAPPDLSSTPVNAAGNSGAAIPAGYKDVTNSPTGADVPLRNLVTRALDARQKWGLVPGSQHGKAHTAQELNHQFAADTTVVDSIFAPGQAHKEKAALHKAIVMQQTGDFNLLGGGVGNVQGLRVALSDTAGTVDLTADTWSKIEQRDPNGNWVGSEPHNTVTFHFDLTRGADGSWIVADYDFQFAPGSAP